MSIVSLKRLRDSLIDRVKTPQAPKMGKIPLPEIEDNYSPTSTSSASSENEPIVILAPTPRRPRKSLTALTRGTTPYPPPYTSSAPTPVLKQQPQQHLDRFLSPSPELKKSIRHTPAPEKPRMSPSEKPPRSPQEKQEKERRGSRSSGTSSRASQDKSNASVYRPPEGHRSLEMPGNTNPTLPAKDAQPGKPILKPREFIN